MRTCSKAFVSEIGENEQGFVVPGRGGWEGRGRRERALMGELRGEAIGPALEEGVPVDVQKVTVDDPSQIRG